MPGAAAAAAAVASPALLAQGRIEKPKLALAVGGKSAFYYLPLTISEQLGYFKAEGLDVEISDFAGGAKALQALMGSSADVVSGAYEHTINMQARNQYIQEIVLMGRAPQISVGVSTKTMPHYKSVHDLKGKKIGVSAPGSSTNMVADLILAKNGMKASDALDVLRFAHFIALAVLTVRFIPRSWAGLKSPILQPAILCGQHSLEIFCLGVFLAFAGHFAMVELYDGVGMQVLVSVAGIGIMIAAAALIAWYRKVEGRSSGPKSRPPGPTLAGGEA